MPSVRYGCGSAARVDASLRVGADDHEVRLALLQVAAGAADRAARADGGHEVRDPALGGLPDLRPGRRVVRLRVGGVRVLVGLPRARRLTRQPVGDLVVGALVVGVHVGRTDDDLGTVGAQQRSLLLRLLVRHHEDAPVALHGGRLRQADAGIAGRRFDDDAAGLQQPRSLRRLDHRQRDPILDRSARVHVLELGHQARTHVGGQPVEGHERRPAHGRGHIGQDARPVSQRWAPPAPGARAHRSSARRRAGSSASPIRAGGE